MTEDGAIGLLRLVPSSPRPRWRPRRCSTQRRRERACRCSARALPVPESHTLTTCFLRASSRRASEYFDTAHDPQRRVRPADTASLCDCWETWEGLELAQVVEAFEPEAGVDGAGDAWLARMVATTGTTVTSVTSRAVRLRPSSTTRMMPLGPQERPGGWPGPRSTGHVARAT